MRSLLRAAFVSSALICGLVAFHGHVVAQEYPVKPLKFIVPYAPGGSSDFLARLLGQKLAEAWGHSVVVDNRPGAAGNIGTEVAAKAQPDGYTMLLVASTFTMNPSVYPKLPFDSSKDFSPVTMILWQPFILGAHPSLPVTSVKQLVELAKARPGELNFSSGGSGTSGHIAAELFKMMAGIKLTHVPYRSMGPAITALLTGEVQVSFNSPLSAMAQIKAGKIRALGVTGQKRLPLLPAVPTISEAGVPGYEEGNWQGVLLPAGTSRSIVVKLNQELVRVLKTREINDRITEAGAEVIANTPEEFASGIRADMAKYARLVKAANIRLD